ncbi:MAG: AbrB/MazE/SpoVT family DNA-binding domain-containing protein [Chloroflexota bacterium]|nr:AbrB/MazE/SpoVT family DNA-binding domain-containing protein [Chloroflexota bacterium]
MSEMIQIRKKAQLTLPLSVRRELGIEEGDFLDIQVRNGEIVLRAKKLIDREQAWFWSERWQHGEKEAQEDINAGGLHHFDNAGEAIEFLHQSSRDTSSAEK